MFLSDEIRKKSYTAQSGEMAWKSIDVPDAVNEIINKDYSILGGDIWIISSGIMEITGFSTNPMRNTETWKQYIERTKDEFLEWFSLEQKEIILQEKDINNLYFMITFATKQELKV